MYAALLAILVVVLVLRQFWGSSGPGEGFEGADWGQRRHGLRGGGGRGASFALLADEFPFVGGDNRVPAVQYSDVWWRYPVFRTGSYAQITNNIQWVNSPENGQAMPSDFCGAFYGQRQQPHSNYTYPLPPVPDGPGVRVGYFRGGAAPPL
jgi:hypothetical protein